MKILYLGGKTAGVIGLLTLLAKGHRPDVIAYSEDVSLIAKAHNLDLSNSLFHGNIGKPIDLLVSVHGREIVPMLRLVSLSYGGINLHPCLWKYKGKDPIRRAVRAGETKFSVGAHRMTERVDEGEVLVERFIDVPRANELIYTEAEIYSKLYPLYSIVLSEALDKVCQS